MGIDTRIAVIVFLFYLLNGVLSFANGQPFLPPLFMEAWLLGGVALLYFVMSIRQIYAILFLLLVFHFVIFLYYPVYPNTPLTNLQWWGMLIPLVLPLVLYAHVFIFLNLETKRIKIIWIFHFAFFIISFWPAVFNNGAIISLVAGILQALTGILLLSHGESKLPTQRWKKRMVLIMILIVYFDVAQYLYFVTSPTA